jgi:caa(3)-type oxidase subunit IV
MATEPMPDSARTGDEGPAANYYALYAVILVLMLVTIAVNFTGWEGRLRLVINLAITCVQVALLSLFFMHLKRSDRLTWIVAASGLFFVAIMFIETMADYVYRHLGGL